MFENINQSTMSNEDREIIADSEKWFKFFVILPKVTTILFAIVLTILGFALIGDGGFLILLGGAIFCALNYAILKITLSYQVLHIYYLKKLSLKNDSLTAKESEELNSLPEI